MNYSIIEIILQRMRVIRILCSSFIAIPSHHNTCIQTTATGACVDWHVLRSAGFVSSGSLCFPSPIPFQNRNDSIHSANSTFYYSYPSETEMDWCTRKAKIDINRRLYLDLTGSQRVMAAGEDVPWNYLRKIIIFNLMFICSSTTHSMIEVGKSQSILISNSDLWTASISFNSDSPPGSPIHQLRCFNYRSFRCQTYNSIVK